MLVPDFRSVVAVAFSFWLQAFAVISLVAPEVLFVLTGRDLDPRFLWMVQVGLAVAGLVSRVVVQPRGALKNWSRLICLVVMILVGSAVAARAEDAPQPDALDIAVPLIATWEGKSNEAYMDIVGVPTICYGSTRGVKIGMRKTDSECLSLLRNEVSEYRRNLHGFLTEQTVSDRLTPHKDAAYTSLAYNAGVRAIGRSTAVRRLNGGNIRGGCQALTWWNKAGGRVIRGLVNRRTASVIYAYAVYNPVCCAVRMRIAFKPSDRRWTERRS